MLSRFLSRELSTLRTDFSLKDSIDYYGLALGKSSQLRYAFLIKHRNVIYGDNPDEIVVIWAETLCMTPQRLLNLRAFCTGLLS